MYSRISTVNNVKKKSSGVEFDVISVQTHGFLAGIHNRSCNFR